MPLPEELKRVVNEAETCDLSFNHYIASQRDHLPLWMYTHNVQCKADRDRGGLNYEKC